MLSIELLLERFPWLNDISDSHLRMLYLVRILRDLLNKITFFFLPIFLFLIGKDTDFLQALHLTSLQEGLITIAIFYGVCRLTILLTAIPLATFSRKIGFDMAVTLSYVARLCAFTALYFANHYPQLIIAAAILEAFQSNLFWNNFFAVLSERLHRKWAGSELGMQQFIVQILSVLSPALSGFLALNYGFEVLFLLGGVISVLSAVLVFSMNVSIPKDEVSWKEFGQWLRNPMYLKLTGSFIGKYINDAALILWPLYVFLILGSIDRVGFLYTFSLFLTMVLTFFIGNYLNTIKTKRPFYFSGGALSLVWVARTQLISVWGIALADTSERLLGNFHWLFYNWMTMLGGKGKEAFSYFVYTEMVTSVGALFFWLIFACFFMVSSSWNGIFLFAGIGVLLSLLVNNAHEK